MGTFRGSAGFLFLDLDANLVFEAQLYIDLLFFELSEGLDASGSLTNSLKNYANR